MNRHACQREQQVPSFLPVATTESEYGLLHWNKERSSIANTSSDPVGWNFADAYVCWNPQYLYLAVYASDFFEPLLYSGGKIPDSERMTWTVAPQELKTPLRVRFGMKDPATFEGPTVWLREWQRPTRNTVLLKLPAAMFGRKKPPWRFTHLGRDFIQPRPRRADGVAKRSTFD